MTTDVVPLDPAAPDPGGIARAGAVIRAGGLVAFPTETVYGLGGNALDAAAVGRIFAAKGRPASNPVIVHVADEADVLNVAAAWPTTAARLAEHFWPGPLTLVLPRGPGVPDVVTAGGPTVAVRCPDHPVARALIRAAGVPVAAPSANRSTGLSPTQAWHVEKSLAGRIDLILDGGPCRGGIESTVVDVSGGVPRVLRPGLVTVPMLEAVVGPVRSPGDEPASEGEVARSPGQMARHYSPRTPLTLVYSQAMALHLQMRATRLGKRVVVIGFERMELCGGGVPPYFGMPRDAERYAAQLYNVLHAFDDGLPLDQLIVVMPPDMPEWSGVRDRLTRAATGERGRDTDRTDGSL